MPTNQKMSSLLVAPVFFHLKKIMALFLSILVPDGHIALIVLDSQIVPAHLLRLVLSFIYTNELSDLDEVWEAKSYCQLASDSELIKDGVKTKDFKYRRLKR